MEKKHLILLIALLAIGFACYVLFGLHGKTVTVEKIVYVDSSKGTTIPLPNNNDVCLNYETFSPSELQAGTIKNLVENYVANQLSSINADASKGIGNDAHSIWFDLDTIKKFIYHIEQGVKNNNGVGSKLGLRMYYASYPNSFIGNTDFPGFADDPIKSTFVKRHTLVILPTITNNANQMLDFDPIDKSTYENGITKYPRLFDLKNEALLQKGVMALATVSGNFARNHGQLCPPVPADGEAFPGID